VCDFDAESQAVIVLVVPSPQSTKQLIVGVFVLCIGSVKVPADAISAVKLK
jgi:hypothetical protein